MFRSFFFTPFKKQKFTRAAYPKKLSLSGSLFI